MSMQAFVWGNRKSCSLCRTLDVIVKSAEFKALMKDGGVTVVDADLTDAPKVYATAKAKYALGGEYPQIVVTDAKGKMLGKFTARSRYVTMTAKGVAAKIKGYCTDCGDPATGNVTCPKCGNVFKP